MHVTDVPRNQLILGRKPQKLDSIVNCHTTSGAVAFASSTCENEHRVQSGNYDANGWYFPT